VLLSDTVSHKSDYEIVRNMVDEYVFEPEIILLSCSCLDAGVVNRFRVLIKKN